MEKAGKSTFANALMENNFLPTDDERCTFTSTQIEYSGDGQNDSAVVSFYSVEIFNQDFRDKLDQLGVANCEQYSFDTLDMDTYMNIYDNEVSDDKKRFYNDTLHEDIVAIIKNEEMISSLLGHPDKVFGKEDICMGRMTEYITDKVKARAVSKVLIRSQELKKMKNAIIFDVPGFNSPTALHKAQTRERMNTADAIIVVANGEHPSLTVEACSVLRESDDEGNELSAKLFVFANRTELAKDILKNVQITYDEWIDGRYIDVSNKHRIIFGSALAHLQSLGMDEDKRALNAFLERENQMPNGDGIEAMRSVLEQYNHNERFEQLKCRVNRIKANIDKVFNEIRKAHGGEGAYRYYPEEEMTTIGKFWKSVPKTATSHLLELKENIRIEMPEKQPLSKEITKYIDEEITVEKCKVLDKMIDEEKKKSPYTGTFEDTARIESNVRVKKFNEMYGAFSKKVINIADRDHVKYSKQILECILKSMEVEKDSAYYSELCELLTQELLPFRPELAKMNETDEQVGVYYQSLIERFSRDLYEVLITSQYNEERLRKFYDSIDNFFALSVFYKKEGDEDNLSYINVAPKDQPLCRMMLFHQVDEFSAFADQICKIVGIDGLPEELMEFAQKTLSVVGGNAKEITEQLIKAFSTVRPDVGVAFKINLIKQILDGIIKNGSSYDMANREAFTGYFTEYVRSRRGNKQYSVEDFQCEFNEDIEILQDILKNTFVRAINIEKPFVARETKSIDDIIDYIDSDGFLGFLTTHHAKIKYKDISQIDKKYREREQNAAIIAEINGILNTMNH